MRTHSRSSRDAGATQNAAGSDEFRPSNGSDRRELWIGGGERATRTSRAAPSRATYVLLPDAGGDSWYWHLVAPKLRARGLSVLTPDLPSDDDSAGLGDYTEAVVSVLGDRTDLIVVAQSLAAFVAPMLCERVDVRLLILVAPMIPSPGESPGT